MVEAFLLPGSLPSQQTLRHCKPKTEAPGYVATVALGIPDATLVE
jgi:hypothetical protein